MSNLKDYLPDKFLTGPVLVTGGAFRAPHEFKAEGTKQRFFFVLNLDPANDAEIVIATATTQIERHKALFGQEVLVEVAPHEYPPLEEDSLINCQEAFTRPQEWVTQKLREHRAEVLEPLPATVMNRIRNAIRHAPTLTRRQKTLVAGPTA